MKKFLMLLILIAAGPNVYSQLDHPIKNLVFEGAGIRGIAYCGAMQELESHSLLAQVEKVGGTSAGAIMALTISLGYTADEITQIIASTDFKKFNDGNYFFIGGITRTCKYFGWYRGYKFEKWLNKLIVAKTGNANITFEQLHESKFKDLYVTGTCINKQRLVIFSHESYPTMRIKDAVRISMSVPFYFEAVFVDDSGNIVRHPRQKKGLDIFVDGGVLGNFPISMFDSTKYFSQNAPNNYAVNPGTLGFRIDNDQQIKNDKVGKGLADMPANNLKQFALAFYNIVNENLNRQPLTSADWARTISISDMQVGPRAELKLSDLEREKLIKSGRESVRSILITKHGP